MFRANTVMKFHFPLHMYSGLMYIKCGLNTDGVPKVLSLSLLASLQEATCPCQGEALGQTSSTSPTWPLR